jgi:vacuolar-type H+-ATPase catalytic subunit A/Vma1
MTPKNAAAKKSTINSELSVREHSEEVRAILAKEAELEALVAKYGHDAASREKKRLKAVAESPESTIADQEAWLDAAEGKLETRWYTIRAMHKSRLDAFRVESWPKIRPLIEKRYKANEGRKKQFDAELVDFQSRWGVCIDVADPFRAIMYDDECRLRWPEGMMIKDSFSQMLG